MKKLREHMMNNRILYRMIAGYTLASTFIILVMTTFFYNAFSRELKNEIYRYQEQSLKQVANTVSFRAEYVNYLMLQAQQDSQISRLFYSADEGVVVEAVKGLTELRQGVKQLHSIYIYNEYDDKIFYSGERSLSSVSTPETFEDKGFVEILENIGQYSKYTPFLRMVSVESPNGQVYQTYVYTYLLYDTYSTGSIKNIMAFNFHLGWMKDALDFISSGKNTSEKIWVVNSDRKVVYSDSGELIGTKFDDNLLPDSIYNSESGYLISGSGRNKQMIVYATPTHSGYENWTFLSWNDYSALMSPMERVRGGIYLICFAAFVFSALIIVLLSRRIYEPVRLTFNRVAALEEEQHKTLKLDRMLFLRKLFLGNVQDDIHKIRESLQKYEIGNEPKGDIRVVLLSVDYLNSFLRKFGNELEKADNVMEDLLSDKFGAVYENMISVKMQEGIWAVCVPAQEEDAALLKRVFEEMNAGLEQAMGITASIAVSGTGHSVRDIPYLYSDALNIHSYLYLFGLNRIITDEDIQQQGLRKYEYPHDMEKRLLSCLFAGKSAESLEVYREFVDEISCFTVEEIKLSFMLLAYAIKNASRSTTAETSSILLEFDRFYKRLQSLETMEEVGQMFIHLISEIVDKLEVYSRERHDNLIRQIKEYVTQNYGNITLSMNEVSDYVDMSAAYLGRLFKQVTGITFTEYLTKYRLQVACNLLRETEMTVNEISDGVGFTNSSYFYIVFKKNLGCTPSQYRNQTCDE